MISIAFVGLCLASAPNVLRLFHRPLRPDVPLAHHFPAWVDSAYGPIELDEVCHNRVPSTTLLIDDIE